MRTIVITGWVLGALMLGACEEKSSGSGGTTPAQSASANAAVVPGTTATSSASAAAEPAKPKAEGPKDHVARIKALDEAFGGADAKKIAALYTEDAVIKTPGQPDVKGREAIQKEAEKMFSVFKDAKLTRGRIWEKDKHVAVVEEVFTGTNTGDAPEMGIPKATNKTVGVVGASWYEVNDDGFIKEEHRYHDMMTAHGQLMPEKKNPVRAAVTAPPEGTEKYEAKNEKEVKEATTDKDKAELAKSVEEEKKGRELEDKFIAGVNSHKMDEAYKLVGMDVVFVDYTMPTDMKGLKAFKDVMNGYLTAFPDMQDKMTEGFGDGEFFVAEYEYTGTQKGALGPIKATNKPIDVHQLEVDQFKDGKLVKGWAWGNNVEMMTELGVMPAPGTAPAPSAAPSAKPATQK